jgi:hypothetical protein
MREILKSLKCNSRAKSDKAFVFKLFHYCQMLYCVRASVYRQRAVEILAFRLKRYKPIFSLNQKKRG